MKRAIAQGHMRTTAEVRLTIRDADSRMHRRNIVTEVMRTTRQIGVFAHNGHLYHALKVETKEGFSDYYLAEIPGDA